MAYGLHIRSRTAGGDDPDISIEPWRAASAAAGLAEWLGAVIMVDDGESVDGSSHRRP